MLTVKTWGKETEVIQTQRTGRSLRADQREKIRAEGKHGGLGTRREGGVKRGKHTRMLKGYKHRSRETKGACENPQQGTKCCNTVTLHREASTQRARTENSKNNREVTDGATHAREQSETGGVQPGNYLPSP